MKKDLPDILSAATEKCTIPISISVPRPFAQRYREIVELTKNVYGRNMVPCLARARLAAMLDEIEAEALKKIAAKPA